MRGYNKQFGDLGEISAAEYLKSNGYQIIEVNYRSRYGELDIICKKAETIVIAEVKTRSGTGFGTPAEAVTKSKTDKIRRTAEKYINENHLEDYIIRFDVIEVYAKKYNDEILIERINHIQDAFI